jgi:hypothetical protein
MIDSPRRAERCLTIPVASTPNPIDLGLIVDVAPRTKIAISVGARSFFVRENFGVDHGLRFVEAFPPSDALLSAAS